MVQLSGCPKTERSNELNVRNPNKTSLNDRSFGFQHYPDFKCSDFGIPLYSTLNSYLFEYRSIAVLFKLLHIQHKIIVHAVNV